MFMSPITSSRSAATTPPCARPGAPSKAWPSVTPMHAASPSRHNCAPRPMGLGAQLWRDGDAACMGVTLGQAFEGAPGRAHGGVVAALLDEVMGLMNMIHGTMAFTAQLDITYLAPTPVGEPIIARAWLARQDNRKQFVEATLHANDHLVASAKALFISIDRSAFLEQLLTLED